MFYKLMLNVHQLELFYFVAKYGGITPAIRQMPYGIQQPAVSGQLSKLEEQIGTRLFERRPFLLTAAGREVFTFIQPFFSYTNKHATTWGVNAESNYNWKTKGWTVPVNLTVSHVYKFGDQRVSLGAGLRGYAAQEGVGPEWGLRLVATFLYPE